MQNRRALLKQSAGAFFGVFLTSSVGSGLRAAVDSEDFCRRFLAPQTGYWERIAGPNVIAQIRHSWRHGYRQFIDPTLHGRPREDVTEILGVVRDCEMQLGPVRGPSLTAGLESIGEWSQRVRRQMSAIRNLPVSGLRVELGPGAMGSVRDLSSARQELLQELSTLGQSLARQNQHLLVELYDDGRLGRLDLWRAYRWLAESSRDNFQISIDRTLLSQAVIDASVLATKLGPSLGHVEVAQANDPLLPLLSLRDYRGLIGLRGTPDSDQQLG